jgi:hypothetical protein
MLRELTTYASEASTLKSGQWRTTELRLPVVVSEQSFTRLLDLRVPKVAAWFTHNLTRLRWLDDDGGLLPAFPRKQPLDRFTDLLPSLAAQDPGGGNGATRIAGQWLRSLGAEGLVFPSARSDASVQVRAGEPVASYGWNLVDYREAAPTRLRTFDLTTDWPRRVPGDVGLAPLPSYGDVALRVVQEGPDAGSWTWRNLERANRGLRQLASSIFLYKWARGNATDHQLRRLVTMLGIADDSKQLAHRSQISFRFRHRIVGGFSLPFFRGRLCSRPDVRKQIPISYSECKPQADRSIFTTEALRRLSHP